MDRNLEEVRRRGVARGEEGEGSGEGMGKEGKEGGGRG